MIEHFNLENNVAIVLIAKIFTKITCDLSDL